MIKEATESSEKTSQDITEAVINNMINKKLNDFENRYNRKIEEMQIQLTNTIVHNVNTSLNQFEKRMELLGDKLFVQTYHNNGNNGPALQQANTINLESGVQYTSASAT